MELRGRVISGMAWVALEKVASLLFQMAAGLALAWFLVPEDFALVAILAAFASICAVFVDSGFSAALIREKEVDDKTLSAVFFFNIATSVVIYIVLVAASSLIAGFYEMPQLRSLAPVMFMIIPANALCIIQSTILTRRLDFKTLTKYTVWANFLASASAVGLAFAGMGVWALVAQRLLQPVFRAALFWFKSGWTPGRASFSHLRPMLGYSSRLLASDLVNSLYSNISQLFIGKLYTANQLGYYEQARKWKDMPIASVVSTVQGVTFPAFSKLRGDRRKLSLTSHQVVMVMNLFMYPIMVGLISVAPDFFAVLLPERWMPAMPLFRILCISGVFVPLSVVSYNIMKVNSGGKTILRFELIKKGIATLVLAVTIPVSVEAIVWGQVVIFLSDAIVNAAGAGRYMEWGLRGRLKETAPYLIFSLVMGAAVWAIGAFMGDAVARAWVLVCKIMTGVVVYFVLCLIFRPEGWREALSILAQAPRPRRRRRI